MKIKNKNIKARIPEDRSYEDFSGKKVTRLRDNNNELEKKYEIILNNCSQKLHEKNFKFLLPIKSEDGDVKEQFINCFNVENNKTEKHPLKNNLPSQQKKSKGANNKSFLKRKKTMSLLVYREKELQKYRYTIGLTCNQILEDPPGKLSNILILLKLTKEKTPTISVTVKKLAMASLLEVFKDILPSYKIKKLPGHDIKLKNETLKLQQYEMILLEYYKHYLKRLEKVANILKQHNKKKCFPTPDDNLGLLAIVCLINLLISKPNFNFSSNIAKYLIPFLDSSHKEIRSTVKNSIIQIFQDDKRGELSLTIVRGISNFLKNRKYVKYSEMLSVLLFLNIKHECYENMYTMKISGQNVGQKLKTNVGKNKKLKDIEKEMLEIKATENQREKSKIFTEIKTLIFSIYFHILKDPFNRTVLSICLEGLSKFSDSLNVYFHQNVISIIIELLDSEKLSIKDQLHCIHTALVMLSEHSSNLSIEPIRFYNHLYANVFKIHLGSSCDEISIVLKILMQFVICKCKNFSENRTQAFVKRASMMSLNLQHNGVIGIICTIRLILQKLKTSSILFETDCSTGDGIFLPELNDPEYCNARCSSLWEIVAWQRYYHKNVKSIAKSVGQEFNNLDKSYSTMEILKKTPEESCQNYNTEMGLYNPNIIFSQKSLKNCKKDYKFTNAFTNIITNFYTHDICYRNYFDLFNEIKSEI